MAVVSGTTLATAQSAGSAAQPDALEQKLAVYRQLLTDWGGLTRYGSENTEIGAPRPGENRVVFFGDDATELWGGPGFFPGKSYLNRGIRGQNSAQMLVRFRQDVIGLKPKVVVIHAGTNDLARMLGSLREEGWSLGGDQLKTAPRGYDAAHPLRQGAT